MFMYIYIYIYVYIYIYIYTHMYILYSKNNDKSRRSGAGVLRGSNKYNIENSIGIT